MTGKERILTTLAGGRPDRVPFVPNIWQWFHVNQSRGTLPGALRHCRSPVETLRALGADVMSKFDGVALVETLHDCRLTVRFEDDGGARPPWTSFTSFEGGNIRNETLETPHGALTHIWKYEPRTGAPFEVEHWWKDFDHDFSAVRAWLEDADGRLDREALARGLANVGDDGIVLFQLPPTPLKKFFWLAGPEQASFFIADQPAEMAGLARLQEQQALAALEEVADLDNVWAFEWPENLDSLFYSPTLFREFCLPVMRRAAAMIHARGKYMFAHACGRLKALAPLILEAGLDCVEGQAHPPLGDWRLDEARALSDRLIVCGGMTATEQEWTGPDTAGRIDRHVSELFASLGDRRRFLFAAGCNTSPRTPFDNLIAFRDAAWKHGGFA
ncbi:MAG: hypothetical protein NTV49_10350 [Kiritimatiellaeota bacterium]|nr:hypothetical protein [Kiritimatiellota bacterium]